MTREIKRKGFTIIELMVVVLIISMLAAFVAPKVFRSLGKAKKDLARPQMSKIESALGRFFMDCERFPTQDEGIDALVKAPEDLEEKWNGRYLKPSELLDPWGNPYIYIEGDGEGDEEYVLICLGADGQEGGEGEDEDFDSSE